MTRKSFWSGLEAIRLSANLKGGNNMKINITLDCGNRLETLAVRGHEDAVCRVLAAMLRGGTAFKAMPDIDMTDVNGILGEPGVR